MRDAIRRLETVVPYRANEPTVPLWPWPMQQRILAATTNQDMAPVPETTLWRRYGWVPQPVDLEARIEDMFGPIPAACRSQWDSDPEPGLAVGCSSSAPSIRPWLS